MPSDTPSSALQEPKVSIVIPVYNGANFLSAAIESALNQTYSNIEIIVVNDGSDDGGATRDICKKYLEQITYLEQDNQGVAGALNNALEHTSGDYFCWLSHDDEFLPEKTQKQLDFLKQFNREDLIVFSNYSLIDDKGEVWHESNLDVELLRQTPGIALLRGMVNGCSLMVPMRLLQRNLPFDTSLRFTQDYEMWDRLRKEAQFVFLPETLIRYRIHQAQDSNATDPKIREESDELWIKMISGRSDTEKVLLNGSRKKYFSELDKFLDTTSYRGAQNFAREQSMIDLEGITVSVVIPFFNNIKTVKKAVQSVLDQSHTNLDVILVNDGSTEDVSQLVAFTENESRIRIFETQNGGPGHARNVGLSKVKGEYIAFLDSDDEFKPQKIAKQLSSMMEYGAIFSHTSYEVIYPDGRKGTGLVTSGDLSGKVYPGLIESCPIATPTVMVHRVALEMGLEFPTNTPLVEDIRTWIWLAQKTTLLGVSDPLSQITWRDDSAALNMKKGLAGISLLIEELSEHPLHKLQFGALAGLKGMYKRMADMYDFAISDANGARVNAVINLDSVSLAFADSNVEKTSFKSNQLIYEVGQSKNASSKKPYILRRRFA